VLEERERGYWQLPRVDAYQALRGKGVRGFPVASHDMDMGRRADGANFFEKARECTVKK